MKLFSELKRRNVFRMAGLYLVGAWLTIQVASTVFPAFDLPSWALRGLIILLAMGFLPAVVFSWLYELTPEGIKRDGEVTAEQSIVASTGKRMDRLLLIGMLAVIGVIAADRFWPVDAQSSAPAESSVGTVASSPAQRSEPLPTPSIHANSIAVMPFVNMSSEPEQEYFSDGMTEELLNALANVPNLAVTARTSVFSLKGQNKDVRDIGKLLGVAFVLEGSVRKAGDELRITAQLIRADNGFHLWSETYDRKLENVFDLQAELAGAIAKALELPLGLGGDAALVTERSADPQAYALYLQARAGHRVRGDGVKKAIALYREVLQRDPKFAPAWAGLASSLAVLPWYVPEAEKPAAVAAMPEAEAAGKQALALSPDLPQAHTALATFYTFQWQWRLAEQHFKRALALSPNDAELHQQYAEWLAAVGRNEEGFAAASKAVVLDPLVPIYLNVKANLAFFSGRLDEVIAIRQAAYALGPELSLTRTTLFRSYLRAGRLDEAEQLLDEIRTNELARIALDPALDPTGDQRNAKQPVRRALIRAFRDPTQLPILRAELNEQDYAALLDGLRSLGAMPDDIDARFKKFERELALHVNGADPIGLMRNQHFDGYRQDPRYIRLLNMAGFDDAGNFR